MAKGKGEMQTYWCDPSSTRRSTSEVASTNPSDTYDDFDHVYADPERFDV